MPFSKRRTFRKRKTFKRKSFRRSRKRFSRKGKPSTARMSTVMKDRAFCKFKFVTIATANASTAVGGGYQSTNTGLVPYSTAGPPTTSADMFVFYPQTAINVVAAANTLTGAHMLPGNSIGLASSTSLGAGTLGYSDKFQQELPTGVSQWASFYGSYICHGSSVQVTMCDCFIPGQLVVMPVIVSDGSNSYNILAANNSVNWTKLTSFQSLPDDQPYARIKFVSSTQGMDRTVIKHSMLTKKLFDVKTLRDDENNQGSMVTSTAVGQDPSINQWAWFIAFIPSTNLSRSSRSAMHYADKDHLFT